MKIEKSKIISIAGIVLTTVVSTLISTTMQDREIEKNVNKHFTTLKGKEEA